MAGVSSCVTFKGLLGKYFSIATVDVIGGGWVRKKYNVKLTFWVATWLCVVHYSNSNKEIQYIFVL